MRGYSHLRDAVLTIHALEISNTPDGSSQPHPPKTRDPERAARKGLIVHRFAHLTAICCSSACTLSLALSLRTSSFAACDRDRWRQLKRLHRHQICRHDDSFASPLNPNPTLFPACTVALWHQARCALVFRAETTKKWSLACPPESHF